MAEHTPSTAIEMGGEEIAVGRTGVESVEESEVLTDKMIRIVADLNARYSNMTLREERCIHDAEKQLRMLEEKIRTMESNPSIICDNDLQEASKYLRLANKIRQLVEDLRSSNFTNVDKEWDNLLIRAYDLLQMAMARLEEEFVHLLAHYRQPMDPGRLSFRSTEDDSMEDFSSSSFGEEPIEGKIQGDSSSSPEEYIVDLINSHAIATIKSIAEVMFLSDYDKECCQAYITARKDALEECLLVLKIEKFTIEELLSIEWSALSSLIRRWNRGLKVLVRVYLASERRLSHLIFGELSKSVADSCFVEISRGSFVQFLSFGEAVAMGPRKPEKLFRILDMYEVLCDLLTDISSLFPNESGFSVLTECNEVLLRLGEAVKNTFMNFKYAIQTNTSTTPFSGGGVHPLTKYVMNYIKALVDYSKTLNSLFGSQTSENQNLSSESTTMALHLQSITAALELNLEGRSKLYKDDSLQNIFMTNNICYMVQKVKDSELRKFIGDDWIRVHNRKFQQHALSYERASWGPVLSFLREEGILSPNSSMPSRTVLKERFRGFNSAFEEVYRIQTAWSVPNSQLRDDLKISISLRVVQAYRTFMGRYAAYLDGARHRERYIKYCAEDVEKYLLDLFERSPKSLPYAHRW
ncbi:exocyst complex component EXO70A1-like isoform X1 [Ananas comosus]|uniref:Exocyst subunit Exo70 family protein n=2 Tax=Ananas comosus TaxID=4615 RepID=A0A6P5F8T3_ANACO|nr:exocyst complex component EXO70A1-like isoform X1 [Ananas comosus]XP_020092359.1 exocyst complex component EXO70A1-like isoform X1 [Ananas comosus]XP_020092360.1 exocyst complex component EXO70A1-like isoform X1 [Ananas comosus]